MRRSVAALAIVLALGSFAQTAQERAPQPYRAEANYIRVDMYPTLGGRPVDDLLESEVEIQDQGVAQKIDRFERVRWQSAQPQARPDPSAVAAPAASPPPAPDSRGRVFVLFLDTNHVDGNFARGISQPLIKALDALISEDDQIAVMTPEMNPRNLAFTSRTTSIESLLQRNWGRDRRMELSPEETAFANCYPGRPGDPDVGIAQEMILRRREQRTLDSLDRLVEQLGTLQREERKAVITISYGWRLFEDDERLTRRVTREAPAGPTIGIDRGRPAIDGRQTGSVRATPQCESARIALGMLNSEQQFREILDRANRTNTSFYPIDPRRVVVFDEDIVPAAGVGVNPVIDPAEDRARLRDRHTALLTMAESTDGIAVVNTSDIDASLQRINDDLSSYYLLGFYSTQKPDGKFHRLTVRVKRPGVQVRARRGYLAATAAAAERVGSGAANTAGAVTAPAPSAVAASLATLVALQYERPLRAQVAARTDDGASRIWVAMELQPVAGRNDWNEGAQVSVVLLDAAGQAVLTERVSIAPGATSGRVELRPAAALVPGEYRLQIGARGLSAGASAASETVPFSVPPAAAGIGVIFNRRGPATGYRDLPTADLRFRRTERVVMEMPALSADAGSARIFDRTGKPLAVPAITAVRTDPDGTRWRTVQIALGPLAPADYVVGVTAGSETAWVAFRVIP